MVLRAPDDTVSPHSYGLGMRLIDVEGPYLRRLREVPALEAASLEELRAVAQVAERLDVAPGAALTDPTSAWRGVYLVARGSLTVSRRDDAAVATVGASVVVDDRDVGVVAVTAATVVAIAHRDRRALRALAPGVAGAIDAAAPRSGEPKAANAARGARPRRGRRPARSC
jgi:hypothetical protein